MYRSGSEGEDNKLILVEHIQFKVPAELALM